MIKDKIDKIRRNPLVKEIGTLITGGAIGQLIALVTAPIITRLYTPEDFGVFSLFLSIALMVGSNSQLAYQQAMVIPPKEEDAQNLFNLCVVLTLAVSFLSGGACIGLHRYFGHLHWVNKLDKWIYWLPPAIFLIGMNLTLNSFNNRHKNYAAIASSIVLANALAPGFRIALGVLHGSSVAFLVVTQLITFFAQLLPLIKAEASEINATIKKILHFEWIRSAPSFRDFPLFSLPSNLFASIGVQFPVIILSALTTPALVGFYALANRLVSRPLMPIQDAVGRVYNRRVAEMLCNGECVRREFVKLTLVLFLLGIIPFGIIAFWGHEFFGFLLGDQWADTGRMAGSLIPWLYTSFILPPANAVLLVGRLNRFRFNYQIVSTIIRLAALYFGIQHFADPISGILLFSVISALANLLLIRVTYVLASNLECLQKRHA